MGYGGTTRGAVDVSKGSGAAEGVARGEEATNHASASRQGTRGELSVCLGRKSKGLQGGSIHALKFALEVFATKLRGEFTESFLACGSFGQDRPA
jgi:hypothetical protein